MSFPEGMQVLISKGEVETGLITCYNGLPYWNGLLSKQLLFYMCVTLNRKLDQTKSTLQFIQFCLSQESESLHVYFLPWVQKITRIVTFSQSR